jgi:hypothetical protein
MRAAKVRISLAEESERLLEMFAATYDEGLPARGRLAVLPLLLAAGLFLLVAIAGCAARDDDATAAVPAPEAVAVTSVPETPASAPTQGDEIDFDTAGSLWRREGDAYSVAGEEDSFAWSSQVVSGPFELGADVSSDWDNYGEAMVVVYGDGKGWAPGCLIFNVTGYWQAIRAHSIYDPDCEWLVVNEEQLDLARSRFRMTIRVANDRALLYVDEHLAASAPLDSGLKREGYIGLVKYGGSAPVTFSNVTFAGREDEAVATRALDSTATPVASATPRPTPTATITPTRTATPPPTETPLPTNTPPPPFRPATGVLEDQAPGGMGELLIKNGTDGDALVILTGTDEQAVKTGYVRASESLNMTGIHDGEYLLYYSKGEAFSEATYRFTQDVTYQRMDVTIPFETTTTQYTIWELTLYGVEGGTVGSERVDPEDFP